MSVAGHHALLLEITGGVVLVGALLVLTLKKKKKPIPALSEADMQRIDSRLVMSDVARSESRFRRRYGVEPKPKDFTKPKAEPTDEASEP